MACVPSVCACVGLEGWQMVGPCPCPCHDNTATGVEGAGQRLNQPWLLTGVVFGLLGGRRGVCHCRAPTGMAVQAHNSCVCRVVLGWCAVSSTRVRRLSPARTPDVCMYANG